MHLSRQCTGQFLQNRRGLVSAQDLFAVRQVEEPLVEDPAQVGLPQLHRAEAPLQREPVCGEKADSRTLGGGHAQVIGKYTREEDSPRNVSRADAFRQCGHQPAALLRGKGQDKGGGEVIQRPAGGKALQTRPGEEGVEMLGCAQLGKTLPGHLCQPVIEGRVGTELGRNEGLVVKTAEAGLSITI